MDLRSIKTDVKNEEDGAWISIDKTTKLKIARWNNKKFRNMRESLSAPYMTKSKKNSGLISDEDAEDILNTVISETILMGFDGLELDGEKIEYSVENAKKLICDQSLKEFRELVVELSTDIDNFREEFIEEAEKN